MPYLSGVFTEPKLEFSPSFSPLVAEYHVTVPYDTLLIKVWAFATSCDAEARLEEKDGLARPANYSLGLGENRINFLVVDLTHTEPWVINTYTLHVYRERHTDTEPAFHPRVPHQVCTMTQVSGRETPVSNVSTFPVRSVFSWFCYQEIKVDSTCQE
ncbi:Cadherin-like and PC-esterase [Branchiostoma belcheri]|nr:Cadherin-like and PC-esterase [Branchiostoma belcheri]